MGSKTQIPFSTLFSQKSYQTNIFLSLWQVLNISKIILECPPQDVSANEVDFSAFLERPVDQTAKGYTLKQRKT